MLKKLIMFVVVGLVGGLLITIGSVLFFNKSVEQAIAPADNEGEGNGVTSAVPVPGSDVPEMVVGSGITAVVTYTDSGFDPQELGPIAPGDKVIFRNESSRPIWPATAMHPTHAVYDGTTLNEHCAEGAAPSFDSCRGIEPGGEWSFIFERVGNWQYHDHLKLGYYGTIVVKAE